MERIIGSTYICIKESVQSWSQNAVNNGWHDCKNKIETFRTQYKWYLEKYGQSVCPGHMYIKCTKLDNKNTSSHVFPLISSCKYNHWWCLGLSDKQASFYLSYWKFINQTD